MSAFCLEIMDFSTKLSCAGPPFEPLHHHHFLTWFGHLYSQEMRILWDIYERFMGDPVSKNPKTIQILQIVRARRAQGKSPRAAQQFLTGNITTSNGACRQGSPFQILGRQKSKFSGNGGRGKQWDFWDFVLSFSFYLEYVDSGFDNAYPQSLRIHVQGRVNSLVKSPNWRWPKKSWWSYIYIYMCEQF